MHVLLMIFWEEVSNEVLNGNNCGMERFYFVLKLCGKLKVLSSVQLFATAVEPVAITLASIYFKFEVAQKS